MEPIHKVLDNLNWRWVGILFAIAIGVIHLIALIAVMVVLGVARHFKLFNRQKEYDFVGGVMLSGTIMIIAIILMAIIVISGHHILTFGISG